MTQASCSVPTPRGSSSPSPRSYGERVGVRGLSASLDRVERPLIPTFSPQAGRRRSEATRHQTLLQEANDGGELLGHPDLE
jgi:hypothetical protein